MFGDGVVAGKSTAVGLGLHAFRDPSVTEDFEAVRLPIDVADFHTYAVDWTADKVDFLIDDVLVRTCPSLRHTRCNSWWASSTSRRSPTARTGGSPRADRGLCPRVSTLIEEVADAASKGCRQLDVDGGRNQRAV